MSRARTADASATDRGGAAPPPVRYARALWRLRLLRVAAVGATSAGVDLAVFNVLLALVVDASATGAVLAANTLAFGCAMAVNFSLNARFSFGVRTTRRSAVAYVAFTAVSLAFYNLNLLWLRALLEATDSLLLNASKLLAMALLVAWNFAGYRYVVFRGAPDRDEAAS